MAAVTKSDMEQLLIELSPLPKYVGDMSEQMKRLSVERGTDRETQVRMEETLKGLQAGVARINGSVTSAVQKCADHDRALERHNGKFNVIDQRFLDLGKELSRLAKAGWGILFLVVAYVVQGVLTKVFG